MVWPAFSRNDSDYKSVGRRDLHCRRRKTMSISRLSRSVYYGRVRACICTCNPHATLYRCIYTHAQLLHAAVARQLIVVLVVWRVVSLAMHLATSVREEFDNGGYVWEAVNPATGLRVTSWRNAGRRCGTASRCPSHSSGGATWETVNSSGCCCCCCAARRRATGATDNSCYQLLMTAIYRNTATRCERSTRCAL